MVRLQIPNLSDNQLNSIPLGICKELAKLATITNISVDLRGNLLSCECEQRDFVQWLVNTKVSCVDRANLMCRYGNMTAISLLDIRTVRDQLQSHLDYTDCKCDKFG